MGRPADQVRTFALGAGCGLLAGVLLVVVLLWQFGPQAVARRMPIALARPAGVDNLDQGMPAIDPPHPTPAATTGRGGAPAARAPELPSSAPGAGDIAELAARNLVIPVDGIKPEQLVRSFDERRGGGTRPHEALDILAPRHTPVRAVEAGTIARLFTSPAGGLTLYQFDPSGRYAYYYAHLERYADGLDDGAPLARGQLIGYVGTSGNAPQNAPHLHFAVFRLNDDRRWWEGTALDPYDILR